MYFEAKNCPANGMDVENEAKKREKGERFYYGQYRVTVNYRLEHKLNLLFREKALLVFFIVCSLGRTY